MSLRSHALDERVSDFVRNRSLVRESKALARLRERTAGLEMARMQISVEQGRLLAVLVSLLGARRVIEVGTFTGYSALCVAERLPPAPVGRLVACDVSSEWTAIGREAWRQAGVADRIDLRLGPASATLAAMITAGETGAYDFAFIDADKKGYDDYYEKCLILLRPGGALAVDNVFWDGRALDPPALDPDSAAIHALTVKAFADDRVDPALVPIGDGLLVVRKR